MSGPVGPSHATAIGFGAVVLWASLAALTIATSPEPPLLLNAITGLPRLSQTPEEGVWTSPGTADTPEL